MNPQLFVPAIISTLHDLFTAIWIGGMIVLAWAILPGLRKAIQTVKTRRPIAMAIQKRLRMIVMVSMVGLWVTGMMMTMKNPLAGGLFKFGTAYTNVLSIKHILMFLMVFCAIGRTIVLRKLEGKASNELEKASAIILFVNIALGVAVLFLSSLLAAISGMPG